MNKYIQIKAWAGSVFVAMLVASCGLGGSGLVGKWQSEKNSGNTVEFFPDGTLLETALLKNSKGTYVLLDGARLKTETEGLLWGSNVATWKYAIKEGKLTLTPEGADGVSFTFTRMK